MMEGQRLIPLMPRLVPQTAFTSIATKTANTVASQNSNLKTYIKFPVQQRKYLKLKLKSLVGYSRWSLIGLFLYSA